MAKGCVYILQSGKDAGKIFGSKDSLAAHMNYTPAMADLMAKYEKSGGKMDVGSVTKWLTDNGYLKAEAKKPTTTAEDIKSFFSNVGNLSLGIMEADMLKTGKHSIPGISKATAEQRKKIDADIEQLKNKYPERNITSRVENGNLIVESGVAAPKPTTAAVEQAKPGDIVQKAENVEVSSIQEKTKIVNSKIKKSDVFEGVGQFSKKLGGSNTESVPVGYSETGNAETVQYANPQTGVVDIIVSAMGDNDFVGFYRIYENGKPTNKWSSKFETQAAVKEDFKNMISAVQNALPQGHEYTETTSISTDGLRVWDQQLNRGYELQYDENGKLITTSVFINGDAKTNILGVPVNKGEFDPISVTNENDFNKVKKALLPYLEKFGLGEKNIRLRSGSVQIDLPVLKQSAAQKDTQVGSKTKSTQQLTTKKEFPKAPVTDAVKTALKNVDNTTAAIMNLAKVLPTVYESIAKQVKLSIGKPASQQIAEAYHNAVENGVEPELVAAVENGVALQEQMKSKPSLADNIETAETLEMEGVPNGVRVSNKASMADLERKHAGNAVKKATIAMARAAAKTLKSVFPMMDIHLHENTADYNNAMANLGAQQNTAGNFTYSTSTDGTTVGRIDINLNRATPRTVVHEVTHAVLLKTFGDSSPAFLEFRNNLEKIISKSGNKRLSDFADKYKEIADDIGQAEEYLAELGGILSDKETPLEYGLVRRIAEMINKAVSAITFGRLKPFEDLQNQKDTLDFFNTIAQSIKAGTDISGLAGDNIFVNEKPNAEGEVGVFKLKSKASIAAPKASEDPRPWIKEFVTDVDLMQFDGKPFVTNMYDYTTAGEVTMGEHKIELMGGKSYVPYMMHKNNKKIGDISNLAAFNSKENAEGFVRNAIEGGANLFAPHSGTLSQSWQFQHHTFAELVNLVLDKNILTNEELIGMFNNIIKSAGNKADFKQFREEYFEKSGKKINNFSSFVKNPKEIVELLDIQNNFAPDLRKTLNSTLSANKKFQENVGIKNKDQFYGLIMDPLNAGVTGGEILGVIDFDPTTFKIVKTTPGATDHHPSFGWALMAKINGIYQPTEFYKSYDVTDTYTKYNKEGVSVSKKSDGFKDFVSSNVKSSAGAIPKIAKFNVGDLKSKAQVAINEYEEAPASEKPALKSKAQVAVFDETGYVSTDFWVNNLRGNTKYLDDVIKSILDARNVLKKGKVTPEQVVKAYMITLGSMGSGGTYYDKWKEKTGNEVSDIFLEKLNGKNFVRPEGAAAAYFVTKDGQKLIDDVIAGTAKPAQIKKMYDFIGLGRETQKAGYVLKSMENGGIKAMTDTFNDNKGKDFAQLYQAAMDNLEGIGEGKTGFFNQYFGVSGRAVIDARELNAWIAGSMKLTPEQKKKKQKAESSKEIGDMLLNRIEEVGLKLGYSPDMAGYIAHHAIWDAVKGSITTHQGEYAVVSGKAPIKTKAQMVDNNAKQVADLYAQMREGGGWAERQKINAILDQDPKLSYIYNNFKAITQMLEEAELLTKSGNCP
jgi:hypothetical protein